jgi:hypothetical protein
MSGNVRFTGEKTFSGRGHLPGPLCLSSVERICVRDGVAREQHTSVYNSRGGDNVYGVKLL